MSTYPLQIPLRIAYPWILPTGAAYQAISCHPSYILPKLNPRRPAAIQKLLEIIGRVCLYPSCSFATALDSDINQTTGSGGHLSMWENRCTHAAVCLLRAGQPRSSGDAGEIGSIHRSILVGHRRPTGLKGLVALPLHFTLSISTVLQADTQSFTFLYSRCPNHLNLQLIKQSVQNTGQQAWTMVCVDSIVKDLLADRICRSW